MNRNQEDLVQLVRYTYCSYWIIYKIFNNHRHLITCLFQTRSLPYGYSIVLKCVLMNLFCCSKRRPCKQSTWCNLPFLLNYLLITLQSTLLITCWFQTRSFNKEVLNLLYCVLKNIRLGFAVNRFAEIFFDKKSKKCMFIVQQFLWATRD